MCILISITKLAFSFGDHLPAAGDNFFKSVSYSIEVICAALCPEEKESLRAVEAQILSKRVELSKFETEYREVRMLHNYAPAVTLVKVLVFCFPNLIV